jgi:hypothetical protein
MGYEECVFHCGCGAPLSGCGGDTQLFDRSRATNEQMLVALAVRAHCHTFHQASTSSHRRFNKLCMSHRKRWSECNSLGWRTPTDYFRMLPVAPHPPSFGWNLAQFNRAVAYLQPYLISATKRTSSSADESIHFVGPALDALLQSAPYPLQVSHSADALRVQPVSSGAPLPIVVYVTSPHDQDMVNARVDFDSVQRVSAQLTHIDRAADREQRAYICVRLSLTVWCALLLCLPLCRQRAQLGVSNMLDFQQLQVELNNTWGVTMSPADEARQKQEGAVRTRRGIAAIRDGEEPEEEEWSFDPVPSASVLRASDGELSMPESLVAAVYLKMNPELKRFFDVHIVNMDAFESTVAHMLLTCERYKCKMQPSEAELSNSSMVCSHASEALGAAGWLNEEEPTPAFCCQLSDLLKRNQPLKEYIGKMAKDYTQALNSQLPLGASLCILPSYLQMRYPCTLAERSVAHPQLRCACAPSTDAM